jgi:lipopolysaccharide/colanic/teichoic acid biosynthesis glycosyltransferase
LVSRYAKKFEQLFTLNYEKHYEQLDYTKWVLLNPESIVYKESEIINSEAREKSPYYVDYLKPMGLINVIVILAPFDWFGYLERYFMNFNIDLPKDWSSYLKKKSLYLAIKRVMDIVLASLALIVLSPVFAVIAAAIKADSKGKIIFSQLRTGKDGKPFVMYKFRSMYQGAEAKRRDLLEHNEMDGPVFKISNDPRITKVGRFIRSYSLDELPQLVNILRGDMSIVGPRPLVVYEADKLTEYENKRHLVKPGLTCYWQIKGRSRLTFQEWIYLDLKYITEMNLFTDLKLILLTFKVVAMKKGVY